MILIIKYPYLLPLLVFFALISSSVSADTLIGGETVYHVVQRDTLQLIGAKLGLDWKIVARKNKIESNQILKIGREIRADNRKIVPKKVDNGIIINIPEKMLYFFRDGKLVTVFPVGVGKPEWQTPTGMFRVTAKVENPAWYVPASIKEERATKGETVRGIVPSGPDNPLGRYAIKTTIPSVLIHETIWPTSVYQFRSHGCIRVLPQNMEKFIREVDINTAGEILYNPVKVAVTEDGGIYLEVHRDIYRRVQNVKTEAEVLINKTGLQDRVDWHKVDRMLKQKSGIAEDITL